MIIDPSSLAPRDRYRLLISSVAPRPIAWISTRARDGSLNLAPFSFFQALSGTPPLVVISIGKRKGAPKDTLRNIEETGEFVINTVTEELAERMSLTSGEWPADVNEFELTRLTPSPSEVVKAPRVAESPLNMEARLFQLVHLTGSDYALVVGEIVRWHVADGYLAPDGLVDIARIRPIARLARDEYTKFGEVISIPRPKVQ
ncbi:MAG: flavin reductase family protein [Chloroflexi bacterium]|nr:flavin reductase family protein [Chloroflexota bacterium]